MRANAYPAHRSGASLLRRADECAIERPRPNSNGGAARGTGIRDTDKRENERMIRRLLTRLASRNDMDEPEPEAPQFAHAATPEGVRLVAIGDIHGRLDLLQGLIAQLRGSCTAAPDPDLPATETHLIFLGDYIDRGPQSAETIEWLINLAPAWAMPHFLRGNHEQCFLDVLAGTAPDETAAAWLEYGGMETLSSYGVSARLLYSGDLDAIRAAARDAVPFHHRRFLAATQLSLRFGDYVFAHAGIRPGVPLDAQREEDLIWIREPFLTSEEDFGAVVVHGHTITPEPQNLPNRIGVDTGAYRHGVLSAVILEERNRRFLSVGPLLPD